MLYLQMDNCWRENKNKFILCFVYLVDMDIFKKVRFILCHIFITSQLRHPGTYNRYYFYLPNYNSVSMLQSFIKRNVFISFQLFSLHYVLNLMSPNFLVGDNSGFDPLN